MQISGVSSEVLKTEVKATEEVLKKYRYNGYNSAVPCASKIAEALQIDGWFAESRPRKKEVFEYEAEDESYKMSQ